ncbi:probable G-protein coupled receptor 139 [Scyliorhinus canicula]|uniref:probable G-protein coupled receptor 139 n=1 Tax=Scyliorhinus canicula TaxID=7830 RepID=UPI0018F6DA9B|nr:probable G-protein coupled receptor 139 [Scyliorhinus canicula]
MFSHNLFDSIILATERDQRLLRCEGRDWNLRFTVWHVTAMAVNVTTMHWNDTTMFLNLRTVGRNDTSMGENLEIIRVDQNLRTKEWNVQTVNKGLFGALYHLSTFYKWMSLEKRIYFTLQVIQAGYYPFLAVFGVPANVATIVTLTLRNCGLSRCVTRYILAMAAADLLVILIDLIFRHIPIVYLERFYFLWSFRVCNVHAVFLYAATDCSVWFTVSFTFDRFVAICCQKLSYKYCTEKVAAVVLGTVAVVSCFKNIFWYFMLSDRYSVRNTPSFCILTFATQLSAVWIVIEFLHHMVTPCVPFVLILLFNVATIRHIVVSSKVRSRLRANNAAKNSRDSEMESRRKSIILLFIISLNFILLWTVLMVYSIWRRTYYLIADSALMSDVVLEIGFMLQLLSSCTNTCIYAVTQTIFREQLTNVLKYPFVSIFRCIQRYKNE